MSTENDDQPPDPADDKVGYCKPPKHTPVQARPVRQSARPPAQEPQHRGHDQARA